LIADTTKQKWVFHKIRSSILIFSIRRQRKSLPTKKLQQLGYQLKTGHFPLFGGFASLNPPCKVTLAANSLKGRA